MEHLTKAQIVLLTLFVSFVASMATGIVVVTLMGQAPDPVNQTITNVVERTIEKITPTFVEKPGKTIVVKDEDLVVAAVEKTAKSTVALRYTDIDGKRQASGVGVIVSADGLVVTDKGNFSSGGLSAVINGEIFSFEIVVADAVNGALVLGRLVPVSSATSTVVFVPAELGNPWSIKVGQTALTLGGRDAKTVASGLITGLDTHTTINKETKVETTILDGIVISQRLGGTSNGAPIVMLDGSIVGFVSIDESVGSQTGIPATEVTALIEKASKPIPASSVKKI